MFVVEVRRVEVALTAVSKHSIRRREGAPEVKGKEGAPVLKY